MRKINVDDHEIKSCRFADTWDDAPNRFKLLVPVNSNGMYRLCLWGIVYRRHLLTR